MKSKDNLLDSVDDAASTLYTAAQNGQVEVIKMLVSLGANVNAPNNIGASPVYVAAGNGHAHVIEALAELGADLHKPTHNGTTPLYAAAHEGQEGAVRALVKLGVDPNAPNLNGITPLYIAAQEGYTDVIRALAEMGATINAAQHHTSQFDSADDSCPPPMYIAAQEGHVEAVRALVEFGGDVNVCCFDGSTPLHVAAAANQVDVVLVLTELGADVHGTTFTGSTPLHLAAQEGHAVVIRALVQVGADVDATDDKACTAAHVAAALGHVDVLSAIIDMRGDVERLNGNGRSPLMAAAAGNHRGAFLALVDAGVDVRQCYFSQDQSVAAFTAEIKTMVDDNSWYREGGIVHSCNVSKRCWIYSLVLLMMKTRYYYDHITAKASDRSLTTRTSRDNHNNINLADEDELMPFHLLTGTVATVCLCHLLGHKNSPVDHLFNTTYTLRQRLVRVALRVLQEGNCGDNIVGRSTVVALSDVAKIERFVEVVCILLDEDMLRDVLALRLTCKSNCDRRRFPVVCLSRNYEELEANMVEEWVAHSCSRLLSTSVVHKVLKIHELHK